MDNFEVNSKHQFASYLIGTIFLFLIATIAGCFAGPNHSIGLEGDVELSIDKKGNLCFEPLFATLTESNIPITIEHLKMQRLELDDLTVPADQSSTILTIVPVDNEYHIIEKGQKICLNTNNPHLRQKIFRPLKPQNIRVLIGGVDDKEEFFVTFYRYFNYPYISE